MHVRLPGSFDWGKAAAARQGGACEQRTQKRTAVQWRALDTEQHSSTRARAASSKNKQNYGRADPYPPSKHASRLVSPNALQGVQGPGKAALRRGQQRIGSLVRQRWIERAVQRNDGLGQQDCADQLRHRGQTALVQQVRNVLQRVCRKEAAHGQPSEFPTARGIAGPKGVRATRNHGRAGRMQRCSSRQRLQTRQDGCQMPRYLRLGQADFIGYSGYRGRSHTVERRPAEWAVLQHSA